MFEPSGGNALGDSAGWIVDTMLGSVATGMCVLAVAFVGLMWLTGRLEWRQGMRVIAGWFIIFGAPVIAAGLLRLGQSQTAPVVAASSESQGLGPREELPRSDYNPHGGASLRDDREGR